ncbi:hypothetical protein HEK616_12330 [Streptomyces nigrescens]|uniref:Uncharacterized protein n=1 Tax=Streptomyces nigrescens TaxID=1920 RepID=A0ABN6QS52_STRNI|nr:hypothetical protein HEK616_12330 [Streptomyces nigrescens]
MAYESSVPYRAGTEGYTSFRIPAVARARSGAVQAFSARALMTPRAGRDAGFTWRTARPTGGLPAGYSGCACGRAELRFRFAAAQLSSAARSVRLDRDTVGLRYETGDFSAYSTITFRRIPVEEPA